ncbi:MAG: transcription elongation factor GreA [Clostridiales bacterium]|jgi:transcription elongation factor GreA|nr:transcription elongation factor GreA [Clostridiales bacterium]
MLKSRKQEDKKIVLTYEGLEKVENELNYLKTIKRKEIAEKIKTATSFGDLSENSEYDEAKNEQAEVETKILKFENMLKNAKVIGEEDIETDRVNLGTKVKILDIVLNKEYEYTIVGTTETNPLKFKISNESPIGSALIGKKVGEIVEVQIPNGVVKFKILQIGK